MQLPVRSIYRSIAPLHSSHYTPVFTEQCYASAVYAVGMCLSVYLSVTLQYRINTAKRSIT